VELIYTYIYNYRGLNDLSLPTSSKYKFTHEANSLKIIKNDSSRDYYNNIPCTLLLGKNGVGKTSILDFINSFIYDFEGSGYCIWAENDQLVITTTNCPLPAVLSPMQTEHFENNEYFFKKHRINLVKINNTIDLQNMLVGRKKKKNNVISKDLSLSYYLQGSKTRSKALLKQLISFTDHSAWAKENLTRLDTKFQFEIENSPTYKVNSILKNNEIGDKGLHGAVEYFFEKLCKQIAQKKLLRHIEYDLDSLGFSPEEFLDDDMDFGVEEIVDLIFNKQRAFYFLATFSYKEILTIMLMPSITWHLIKMIKIPKDLCEEIYLYCLCRVYLEDATPSKVIAETLNNHEVNENALLKMNKLTESIYSTIDNIAEILTASNNTPIDSLSFTLEEPKQILELIKLVDKLPTGISSRFRYGWDSLSSGEFAKLNLFNQLYESIEHSNSKNIIILLDECDLYLHPEWQRVIFTEILDLINAHKGDKNVQVLFTTHSPILASDFLPSDIIYLEKDKENKTYIKKIKFGFGATISELYINGFFIDATIGQYAHQYIKSILKNAEMNNLNKNQKSIINQIKNELLKKIIKDRL